MSGKRRMGRDPVPPKRTPVTPATPVTPVAPPDVIAPRVTRRQARLDRRREQRRRIGTVGVAAIVVAALVVLAGVVFGAHKVLTRNNGNKRTQTTVLLQIQGPTRAAAASVLLAHNPGVEVLVPTHVITQVCGFGSQNFGAVLALPNGVTASRVALSSMLNGVTVDGSWILQSSQLVKLINGVGGITVNVNVNVVRRTPGGGGQVLVPAGDNRRLNGTQAVEYALYATSSHAPAAAELARLQLVIDATIQALPKTVTGIAAQLRPLGAGSTSTLGATRLATLLAGLAADDHSSSGVLPTDLPVTAIDAGGSSPSYRLDAAGVRQLVSGAGKLANSVPSGAGKRQTSVLLLNGVGTPGLVQTACPRLASAGFSSAGSGNAGTFNNPTSSIQIGSDADIAVGDRVAHALHLRTADVQLNPEDQSVADVIVILGNDYCKTLAPDPCQ